MEPVEEKLQGCCCISHSFQKVALENPNKIAVIEASPTAQLHNLGDRSFTFSQLGYAIDALSSRLCSILDGANDPLLINPTGQSTDLIDVDSIFYNRYFSGSGKLKVQCCLKEPNLSSVQGSKVTKWAYCN